MSQADIQKYKQISKPLPKLYPAQRDLYDLIFNTCSNGGLLNTKSAFEIYKKHAQGKGWTYDHYDHEKKQCVSAYKDWTPYLWEFNFKNWILRALGALVYKGYLRILPAIDFSELEQDIKLKLSSTENK